MNWGQAVLTPHAHECPRHAREAVLKRGAGRVTMEATCGCTAVITRPNGPEGHVSIAWEFVEQEGST